ncbi:MAG: hypothetical protein ACW987_18110 [Candidatus Thorarchaeota archaeon]|jgi:predicted glycosyltransferase
MKKVEIKADHATLQKHLASHQEAMNRIVRLFEINNIPPTMETILALFNIAATTIRDHGLIDEEGMHTAVHTLFCQAQMDCEICKELTEVGAMISLNASEMDLKDMN